MSLECYIGPEGNLLETTDGQAHRLLVPQPILTNEELAALEQYFQEKQTWDMEPPLGEDGWLVIADQTRELRAGHGTGEVTNAYAWNLNTGDPGTEDASVIVQARFRVVHPGPLDSADPWGFGLCTNLTRTNRKCMGYRLAVRGRTDEEGFSIFSELALEKLFNPSSPDNDYAFGAQDPPVGVQYARTLDIPGQTAVLTSGVWYWLKIQAKRQRGLVSVAGKFWVGRAADEPQQWTLGPAYDAFPGATLPEGIYQDNFPEKPIAGGSCGVWADGGEISADDFTVESEKGWEVPPKILLQPVALTVPLEIYDYRDPDHLEVLDPYVPGSFPLTYLPDGSAEQDRAVLVRITDITDAKKRVVPISTGGRLGEL